MMAPGVSITVGSARYDVHAAETVVSLGLLPSAGAGRITLPAAVSLDAAPGDDVEVALRSGEDEAVVLSGTLRSLRRGLHAVELLAADAGALLGSFRPAITFEAMSVGNVIRKLAGEVGVDVQVSGAKVELPYYAAHPGQTAAEHTAALARLCGCLARVKADGVVDVYPIPGGRPEAALRYGRELLEYEAIARPVRPSFVRLGSGPSGSASAPDALQPSFDRLPASAPRAGVAARWIPTSLLKTPRGAATASDAESLLQAASVRQVRAVCFLLPGIRPGDVIEVQDLPGSVSGGPWLVTRVRHQVSPAHGARTILEGQTADADSLLGGLVGAALSAAGGLL